MNMVVIAKKSLFVLCLIGSVQLVAMNLDSSNETKNSLLVREWDKYLGKNIIKYQERLHSDLSDKQLRRNRDKLNFFVIAWSRLRYEVAVRGVNHVGAVLAHTMNKQKNVEKHEVKRNFYIKQEKEGEHKKRCTL